MKFLGTQDIGRRAQGMDVRSPGTLRDGGLGGRIYLFTGNFERHLKGGSTDGASLSVGAPFRRNWREVA
jgi:hypothetical protein